MPKRKKKLTNRQKLNKALAMLEDGMAKAKARPPRISLTDLKAAAIKRRSGGA